MREESAAAGGLTAALGEWVGDLTLAADEAESEAESLQNELDPLPSWNLPEDRPVVTMRELAARYPGGGDVLILGIHSPEFDDERKLENVRRAIADLKLPYAVAQDNDFAAWKAFHNGYWPALYVLGPDGVLRATHVGELHVGTRNWTDLLATIDGLRKGRG